MTDSMRRMAVILLLCGTAALPIGLGLLVAVAKPQTSTPPDYSQTTQGRAVTAPRPTVHDRLYEPAAATTLS